MSSNEKTLTIGKRAITISTAKTEAAVDEAVQLTVTGVTNNWVRISSSVPAHTTFPGGVDNNPAQSTSGPFEDQIDFDGKRIYDVEFDDTGSYTITVQVLTGPGGGLTGDDDSVDITAEEKAVTLDIPSTIYIGEKVTIKGTANTGDTVAIAFDNVIPSQAWATVTIGADGEFSKDIRTGIGSDSTKLMSPGSVRIKAFVNLAGDYGLVAANFPNLNVNTLNPPPSDDGSTAILLSRGKLKAELSTKSVATGDDFTVSGSAEGPRFVDIFTVAPKGPGGDGLDPAGITWVIPATAAFAAYNQNYPGCSDDNVAVSETDKTYSKKLDVQEDADTGTYLVAVLSRGIDGYYGDNQGVTLEAAIGAYVGDISSKTQEQVLSILEGLTTRPGSDDQMWIGYIKVETPYVRLDPIESVAVGEPLKVTGESNRADGFTIVVTCKNGEELDPATVPVTNGTFEATFDTTGAPVGTYTVKADDGDGHTDDAKVDISEKAKPTPPPAPTATAKPTAAPAPTVAPTATPEPTPTKTPGFGAVFAIAGMLAIAYLVLRKRRE
jgi:PGF-CTERM protein